MLGYALGAACCLNGGLILLPETAATMRGYHSTDTRNWSQIPLVNKVWCTNLGEWLLHKEELGAKTLSPYRLQQTPNQ
jgi:hypothetical protein